MNLNGLTRHYDQLTPGERLALLCAAAARGDEAERQRLFATDPRQNYAVGRCAPLGEALRLVTLIHQCRVLNLVGDFRHCAATLDLAGSLREHGRLSPKEEQAFARIRDAGRLVGRKLLNILDGWTRFCEQLRLPGEFLLDRLPGREAVRQAEASAKSGAFTDGEARAFLGSAAAYRNFELPDVAAVALDLHDAMNVELGRWEGASPVA